MTVVDFTWQSALFGGLLIGLAAVMMMGLIGRIAGMSSIVASLMRPVHSMPWQWSFILGLVSSGVIVHWFYRPIELEIEGSTPILIIAGLLVGFGTRYGSGCTSGHGVCGISRLSPRSIIATLVFMITGIVTVWLMRQLM